MSRRVRICLIVAVVLAVGIEAVVRLSDSVRTSVEITNMGQTPINDLVVSFEGSRIGAGHLAPGETRNVGMTGTGKGTLSLAFTQQGNPMSGFLVADYDPRDMHRNGLKLIIQIKPNEVLKYMDDETASTPLSRLRDRIGEEFTIEGIPAQ